MKRYGMCVITGRCDTYLRIVPFPTFINITTLNYIYIYTYLLKFSDNTLWHDDRQSVFYTTR